VALDVYTSTQIVKGADVIYLCDWLPPDFGAVGQYSLEFARARAREGHQVVLYGLSSTKDSVEEESFGRGLLRTVRLKSEMYDRASFGRRAAWTLTTNLSLLKRAFSDMRASREIVFTGSPPLMLHLIAPLNLVLRKRLIYRITDFYPECLMAEYTRIPRLLHLMYRLTLFWRRRVSGFEVLGEDQRARLIEAGILADRIVLKRDPSPVTIDSETRPLETPAPLKGFKILLYSGNFGVAHDYATFLEGYRKYHREGAKRVAIWINAIGRSANALEDALKAEGLPHFRTKPVPLEQLASLLITPDAHLITLHDRFSGFVLPSKVYGCIESRKPILYVGPKSSDVHLLCTTRMGGVPYTRVAVGNGQGVFDALQRL
jgi:hypothetical protein